jgi:hypothetical protein
MDYHRQFFLSNVHNSRFSARSFRIRNLTATDTVESNRKERIDSWYKKASTDPSVCQD